jgi:hypothetical protein
VGFCYFGRLIGCRCYPSTLRDPQATVFLDPSIDASPLSPPPRSGCRLHIRIKLATVGFRAQGHCSIRDRLELPSALVLVRSIAIDRATAVSRNRGGLSLSIGIELDRLNSILSRLVCLLTRLGSVVCRLGSARLSASSAQLDCLSARLNYLSARLGLSRLSFVKSALFW